MSLEKNIIVLPTEGRAEKASLALVKAGGLFGTATLGTISAALGGVRVGSEIWNRWVDSVTGPMRTEADIKRAARETTAMVARSKEFVNLVDELNLAGLIPPYNSFNTRELFDAVENVLFGIGKSKVAELITRAQISEAALPAIVAESKEHRALVIAGAAKLGAPIEGGIRESIRIPMAALEQFLVSGAGVVEEGGTKIIGTTAALLATAFGWIGALPAMGMAVLSEAIPPIASPIPIGIFIGILGAIAIAVTYDQTNITEDRFWVSVAEGILIGGVAGCLVTTVLGIFAAKFGGFGGFGGGKG